VQRRTSKRAMIVTGIALGTALLGLKVYTSRVVRRAEAAYPPAGDFVTVEGVRLHYVERGSGPPVILIHGDGGSVKDWTMSMLDDVAQEHRAIAFDRPGLGYSERPDDGASPFVQARLLHEAAEELGLEEPILVGHSRGGNVALAYGLSYPDDVGGLVTLAAAPYGGMIALHNRLLTVPALGPILAHTAYVPLGRGAVRAGLDAAFAPEGTAPPEYVDAYAAYELRPGQLLAHARDQVLGRKGTERMMPRYDEIRVPLVIVHGTEDGNVPVEQARRLHRAAPESRLMAIEGAGHELLFKREEAVLEAISLAREMR